MVALLACSAPVAAEAAAPAPVASAPSTNSQPVPAAMERRLVQLGTGDGVNVQVYGQPDMNGTVYVADDGTIPVALVGSVRVTGLSPAEAAQAVEKALRDGKYLVDPHVTLTVVQSSSQRVSVLGEVGLPGRYAIESTTSIFDLLAMAGGAKENAADVVYLLRAGPDGKMQRYPINLKGLTDRNTGMPSQTLKGGDSIMVPRADQFYIFGEVTAPNMYRIEPGMTVVQAIARAGGITPRGSKNRIEVKRKSADGQDITLKIKLTDPVQANDVIRVKESIF